MGLASSLRSRSLSRLGSLDEGDGEGTGLEDEPGVGVDEGPDVGVGDGAGVGDGPGVGLDEGPGVGVGGGVGEGSDEAVGVGDGLGSGLGGGLGEGVGSGSSGGGTTSHSPAASVMAARRARASAVFPVETALCQAATWTA